MLQRLPVDLPLLGTSVLKPDLHLRHTCMRYQHQERFSVREHYGLFPKQHQKKQHIIIVFISSINRLFAALKGS